MITDEANTKSETSEHRTTSARLAMTDAQRTQYERMGFSTRDLRAGVVPGMFTLEIGGRYLVSEGHYPADNNRYFEITVAEFCPCGNHLSYKSKDGDCVWRAIGELFIVERLDSPVTDNDVEFGPSRKGAQFAADSAKAD